MSIRITENQILRRINGCYVLGIECTGCKKIRQITLQGKEMYELQTSNKLIQRILPNHTAGEREMLISQTCEECWEQMFREETEEEGSSE